MQDQVHADQFSKDGRTRPAEPNAFYSMWAEMMPGAFYRTRAGGITMGGMSTFLALSRFVSTTPKGETIEHRRT